jgi:uncharacterized RDD family membrane protein YckC
MDPEADHPTVGDPGDRPEADNEATRDEPGGAAPEADLSNGDARGRSLAGRIFSTGSRGAQRFADISGLDEAIESAVEEAIVRSIESEATENAIARVVNGPLIEQAVAEAMASESVENAIIEALDSEMAERVWDHVLDGPHTQRLIERIAESPEVRSAIAAQGIGLIGDLGYQVSKVTRILDFIGERVTRRMLFRSRRVTATSRAGFFTRVLALGIDALIVNFSLILLGAVIGAIGNALGFTSDGVDPSLFAVGATLWLLISSLYLYVFWALSGQTPGMRFLDIRIEKDGEHRIGSRAARRRLVGFWLSAAALGLGFIGVLIRLDRRGFHDRLGDTTVYFIDPTDPDAPHDQPVL